MAKNKAKKGATAPKVETKAAEEVKVQAAVETKVEDKAPKTNWETSPNAVSPSSSWDCGDCRSFWLPIPA